MIKVLIIASLIYFGLIVSNELFAQPYGFTHPSILNSYAENDLEWDTLDSPPTYGNGVWMIGWTSKESLGGELGSDSDVFMSRSTDDASTWSVAKAFNPNAATDTIDDQGLGFSTDQTGTWVATWSTREYFGASLGSDYDLLVSRSTDNGYTWSPAVFVNSSGSNDPNDPDDNGARVISDQSGKWIIFWISDDSLAGTIGSDRDILFSVSVDNGATWGSPSVLNSNAATDDGDDNSINVATNGNDIVVVWHSDSTFGGLYEGDPNIFYTRSEDFGETWSAPVAVNSNAAENNFPDGFPNIATDGIGTWVIAWSGSRSMTSPTGADEDIFFSRSIDNGHSWSANQVINTTAYSDFGADRSVSIATDGNGNWLAVWQSQSDLNGSGDIDLDIFASISIDNGSSWQQTEIFNPNATTDVRRNDTGPLVNHGASGNWVVVWGYDDAPIGSINKEYDIKITSSQFVPVILGEFLLK